MKQLSVRLLLFSFLFMTSCSKSSNSDTGLTDAQLTSGTWRVTLFKDSGNDETSDFSGYSFAFGSGGVLTTTKTDSTKTGTWNKGSKFSIDLGSKSDNNKPLGELTDDWNIISTSATRIELGDDNAASGELLTFTKN